MQQVLELCLVSKWFMIFQSVYSAFRDPVNMLISSTGLKLRVRPEPPPPPPPNNYGGNKSINRLEVTTDQCSAFDLDFFH